MATTDTATLTSQTGGSAEAPVPVPPEEALRHLIYAQLFYPAKYAEFVKNLNIRGIPFDPADTRFLSALREFSASFPAFLKDAADPADRLETSVPLENIQGLNTELQALPDAIAAGRREYIGGIVADYVRELRKKTRLSGEDEIQKRAVEKVLAGSPSANPQEAAANVAASLVAVATDAAGPQNKAAIEEVARPIAASVVSRVGPQLSRLNTPLPQKESIVKAAIDNPLTDKHVWIDVFVRSASRGEGLAAERIDRLALLAEGMAADTSGVDETPGSRATRLLQRSWRAETAIDRLTRRLGETAVSQPAFQRFLEKGNSLFGAEKTGPGILGGLRNLFDDVAVAVFKGPQEPIPDILHLAHLGIVSEVHLVSLAHVQTAGQYSRRRGVLGGLAIGMAKDQAGRWVMKKAAGTAAGKAVSAGLGKLLGSAAGALGGPLGAVAGFLLGDKVINFLGGLAGSFINFITGRRGSGKEDAFSFSSLSFVLLVIGVAFIPIILWSLFVGMNQQAMVNYALTSSPTEQGSRYIGVTKTPSATVLPNGSTQPITYTVTIQATEVALTSIVVDDTFSSYSQSGRSSGQKPNVSWPTSLAAGETFSATYALPAGTLTPDTAIVNTLTVTATAGEKTGEQTTVSSSVVIGSPPTGCLVQGPAGTPDAYGHVSSTWSATDWAVVVSAASRLSASPAFFGKICSGGSVPVFRVQTVYYGGAVSAGRIFLYNGGVSQAAALYTLAHELGHILAGRDARLLQSFYGQGFIQKEGFLWTYPFDSVSKGSKQTTGGIPSEDFAETIGAYVVYKFYSFKTGRGDERSAFNYPTEYPQHYDFARNTIFGGVEF